MILFQSDRNVNTENTWHGMPKHRNTSIHLCIFKNATKRLNVSNIFIQMGVQLKILTNNYMIIRSKYSPLKAPLKEVLKLQNVHGRSQFKQIKS